MYVNTYVRMYTVYKSHGNKATLTLNLKSCQCTLL